VPPPPAQTYPEPPKVAVPDGPIYGPSGPALNRSQALTRIAFGSCLQQDRPLPIVDAILADKPQAMLMMGDNVYGDVKDASMAQLRRAYYVLSQKPEWRRLRAAVPMLQTWDDHDYGDNDAGADFPHKRSAQQLFIDFWRLPKSHPARSREGVYDSVIVGPRGKRVQIVLLDLRAFRGDLKKTDERNAPGKERYLPNPDPSQSMLGAAQWAWLERELRKPADLRLIVSSMQVIGAGHGWESWDKLPLEQARLYRLIADTKAKGVVFLSGDRHIAAIYRKSAGAPYPFYEVTSSSLNLAFLDSKFTDLPQPERLTATFRPENYGLLGIDWNARALTAEVKDVAGKTVHSQIVPFAEIGLR
jgi:alkaline phosphatase D